jgi:copper resistance protein C
LKKLLFFTILTFIFVPSNANAHTSLTSSNPADGQVVNENLTELLLVFEGEIESLSTMKLLKDGQEVPLNLELQEKQMIGTVSTPLDNGSYVIEWNIAGEDGHLITGEIPFTVQLDQGEQEQTTETKEPTPDQEETKTDNQAKTENTNAQNNNQSSNPIVIIVAAIAVLILGVGVYMLFGRKR